jgi:hypothetical protein
MNGIGVDGASLPREAALALANLLNTKNLASLVDNDGEVLPPDEDDDEQEDEDKETEETEELLDGSAKSQVKPIARMGVGSTRANEVGTQEYKARESMMETLNQFLGVMHVDYNTGHPVGNIDFLTKGKIDAEFFQRLAMFLYLNKSLKPGSLKTNFSTAKMLLYSKFSDAPIFADNDANKKIFAKITSELQKGAALRKMESGETICDKAPGVFAADVIKITK